MNYENEILKIKKKRSRVMGLLIAIEILILIFTSPVCIVIADNVIVDYQGMPFIVTLILMFICFVVGAFAYTAVSMPVYYAMDREADPEKPEKPAEPMVQTADAAYIWSYPSCSSLSILSSWRSSLWTTTSVMS